MNTFFSYLVALKYTNSFFVALEFHKSYVGLNDLKEITSKRKNSKEYEEKVNLEIQQIKALLD